jgi:hypothetical protein
MQGKIHGLKHVQPTYSLEADFINAFLELEMM